MPAKRRTLRERSPEQRDSQICPAVKSISKVGNELRLVVIRYLIERPMRFNELMSTVATIDPKSLSRVLKYLVVEGIAQREVLDTQPFAVRYSLTEKGMELRPVVESLRIWGLKWLMAPQTSSVPPESATRPRRSSINTSSSPPRALVPIATPGA